MIVAATMEVAQTVASEFEPDLLSSTMLTFVFAGVVAAAAAMEAAAPLTVAVAHRTAVEARTVAAATVAAAAAVVAMAVAAVMAVAVAAALVVVVVAEAVLARALATWTGTAFCHPCPSSARTSTSSTLKPQA